MPGVCAVRVKSRGGTRGEGAAAVTLWVRSPASIAGCSWSELGSFWAARVNDGDDNCIL